LARVIQRSRAVASGSSQHQEATTSEDFTLPPTCTSTRRDEPFVLYDGSTDRGVRVIIFATSRNMEFSLFLELMYSVFSIQYSAYLINYSMKNVYY